jgi:hypothetical protein
MPQRARPQSMRLRRDVSFKEPNKELFKAMLREAKLDLTGRELAHFKKHSGALRMGSHVGGGYLFAWRHADSTNGRQFAKEVQAKTADQAKAFGIITWLEQHAPAMRAKGWPEASE